MSEAASLVRPLRLTSGMDNGLSNLHDEHDLERSGLGTGVMRSWHSDNATVMVVDAELHHPQRQRMTVLGDVLLVRAASSGDCRFTTDSGTTWEHRAPAVTVAAIPRGAQLEIEFAAGVLHRSLSVLMPPSALFGLKALAEVDVPAPLRELGESPLVAAKQLLSMPMSPDILSLLYDLRHSRLEGQLRTMQMATRGVELLLLMAAEWSAQTDPAHGSGLLQRDADLLAAARHVLLERCTAPPTLMHLARQLGTNKNKLNRLFRDRFGTTPQGYALERRMERAQSLIAGGRMTFGQVADAVGYQHQSSFTTAFRQALGVSPREYASRVCEAGVRSRAYS